MKNSSNGVISWNGFWLFFYFPYSVVSLAFLPPPFIPLMLLVYFYLIFSLYVRNDNINTEHVSDELLLKL